MQYGELAAYSRERLLPPEDLAERVGRRLYGLVDPEHGGPELWSTGKGNEACVWLYSDVSLLLNSCGDGQPYAPTTPEEIIDLARAVDVTILAAIDVWHPDGARYPDPVWDDLEPIDPIEDPSSREPVVWIPTRPVRAGDQQVKAELHGTREGERLLLVFGSREQAWQACGPFQPLSAIHADRVDAVARACGAHGVVTNGVLAEEARHPGPVRDWR